MSKHKKVYHYITEDSGNLLPVAIYNSIVEASRDAGFNRTSLSYHLNRYGKCSYVIDDTEAVHVLSLRSLIVPNSIEPISPRLCADYDIDLEPMIMRTTNQEKKEESLAKKIFKYFVFW
jgi:hypothetical protein